MADRNTTGDTLTFRLGTHSDYAAVMSISEGVYGGRDYLPAFYRAFMADPDVIVFLALVGSQVVGLRASKITENETAFIDGKPVILVDWEPYTLSPANLKRLQANNTSSLHVEPRWRIQSKSLQHIPLACSENTYELEDSLHDLCMQTLQMEQVQSRATSCETPLVQGKGQAMFFESEMRYDD
ncbi:histidine N-acetyltransferase [Branchiostoma belcheri]|nr:histidine N-acetyltransferase [Branchiostoma belcheri]